MSHQSTRRRVVVVTGGAAGIGRAIVHRLVQDGFTVLNLDRNSEKLKQVEQEEGVGNVVSLVVDLVDAQSSLMKVQQCVESTFEGRIDGLVNNAGLQMKGRELDDVKVEEWDVVNHVNLRAYWVMAKVLSPFMKPFGFGRIVNISSIHSKVTEPGRTVYASTKGAINALTEALAVELAPHGIIVNAVAPGFCRTEMSVINGVDETETDEFIQFYQKGRRIPLARAGLPHEVVIILTHIDRETNPFVLFDFCRSLRCVLFYFPRRTHTSQARRFLSTAASLVAFDAA